MAFGDCKQHTQGEKVYKFNIEQIKIIKQQRLGGNEEQPLLLSLVHLILC
jgi:hypothetical protein